MREAADEAVLQEGYPIRTIGGNQSPDGQIELFFGANAHIHTFHTHPNTFLVYRQTDSESSFGIVNDRDISIDNALLL